jgi:hypothetical protein
VGANSHRLETNNGGKATRFPMQVLRKRWGQLQPPTHTLCTPQKADRPEAGRPFLVNRALRCVFANSRAAQCVVAQSAQTNFNSYAVLRGAHNRGVPDLGVGYSTEYSVNPKL